MAAFKLLTIFCFLTTLPEFYTMSLDANVTANNEAMLSLASSAGGLEMRKLRHIEAELEVLRRTVTELKAGGQCASQSPQSDILKEVTTEIQALRSQFHGLQMQRDLSALRSDILRAQSLLADAGSKGPAVLEHDAGQLDSASAGKTGEAGNEQPGVAQNITLPLSTGTVYKRWGHDRCPNDTELVYSGVVAGSHFDHVGAAANTLCLPLNPALEAIPSATTVTYVYGAEFKIPPLPRNDLDPLCAVCRSLRATVVMVPAAIACHSGWTMEYSGYLMAGHYSHTAATEFVCVDKEQQTRAESDRQTNGKRLYYVATGCGSLPCPPYVGSKVLPCVVCSK